MRGSVALEEKKRQRNRQDGSVLSTHIAFLEDLSSTPRLGGSHLTISPDSEALPLVFMGTCAHTYTHTL